MVRQILLGPEKAALKMSPMVATVCLAKLPAESAQLLVEHHPRFNVAVHPTGVSCWIGGK